MVNWDYLKNILLLDIQWSVSFFNQGNSDYVECGTIIGGPCNGDTLGGTGIYEADDQEGCICKGITANVALVRQIWVVGKFNDMAQI